MTTEDVPQLNIDKLKGIYFNEGSTGEGNYRMKDSDPPLYLESDCRTADRILRVKYEVLDRSKFMDYGIKICTVPSNRGNGLNHYFICPVSSKKAKILYLCYETNLFVHRDMYPERIYYPSQLVCKKYLGDELLDMVNKKLLGLFFKIKKQTYQGRHTRVNDSINKLIYKKKVLELLCIEQMENYFAKWEAKINRREKRFTKNQ